MKRILTLFAAALLAMAGSLQLSAQSGYEVKGVVEDKLGPVIGAIIMEVGTTKGTSTDIDGAYTLKVSGPDAMVEIGCLGYASRTFKASELPATVMLAEDSMFLE